MFRLRHVVYCPSLGARLDAVFMHGLSQIACMRPSIEHCKASQGRLLLGAAPARVIVLRLLSTEPVAIERAPIAL